MREAPRRGLAVRGADRPGRRQTQDCRLGARQTCAARPGLEFLFKKNGKFLKIRKLEVAFLFGNHIVSSFLEVLNARLSQNR